MSTEIFCIDRDRNIEKASHPFLDCYLLIECLDICAKAKVSNSTKRTLPVLHLMACAHLQEQQWLQQACFSDSTFY